jgi:hypothetical protein
MNIKEYLKSIENNYKKANTTYSEKEILKLGYKHIGRFKTGYNGYNGYKNEPREVLKRYSNSYNNIFFSINEQEGFEISYSVYGIEMEE